MSREIMESPAPATRRIFQNEVLQRCVIPGPAGFQSPGACGLVWMPAFAGMTPTIPSHPLS
jgi:hypothetical protein